jgi:DNA-binding CsgD family transcriptional regulator
MLDKIFLELFDHVKPISKSEEPDAFFRSTRNLYGLKNISYLGVNLPTSDGTPYYVHNTYSEDWLSRYHTERYLSVDPIIRLGLKAMLPVDWSDIPNLTPEQRRMFGESCEFGVGSQGLTFPLHGLHGETAVFSIASDFSKAEWFNFKRSHLRDMRIIADFFHQRVLKDALGPNADAELELTDRELECLKWSAEGKTYEDTGTLLGISARTVRFFLENARHKLGSLNTTHAVASAMLRGLI